MKSTTRRSETMFFIPFVRWWYIGNPFWLADSSQGYALSECCLGTLPDARHRKLPSQHDPAHFLVMLIRWHSFLLGRRRWLDGPRWWPWGKAVWLVGGCKSWIIDWHWPEGRVFFFFFFYQHTLKAHFFKHNYRLYFSRAASGCLTALSIKWTDGSLSQHRCLVMKGVRYKHIVIHYSLQVNMLSVAPILAHTWSHKPT